MVSRTFFAQYEGESVGSLDFCIFMFVLRFFVYYDIEV